MSQNQKYQHIGKVYQLSFPFTDASKAKSRPTVIVIEDTDDFEALYITTQKIEWWIEITDDDFLIWGLQHDSYIKITKSMPFSKELFTEDNFIWLLSLEKMKVVLSAIINRYAHALQEVENEYGEWKFELITK